MIWPFQILLAAVIFAASVRLGRWSEALCISYSIVALSVVQVWKALPVSSDFMWFLFFVTWLGVSALVTVVPDTINGEGDAKQRQIDTSALMLVGVSLCYFWGWAEGADFFDADAQHTATEVLCALSWLIVGGRSLGDLGTRIIHSLGSRLRVGDLSSRVYLPEEASISEKVRMTPAGASCIWWHL